MSKTALIFAAAIMAYGPAALAQPADPPSSIHVSFADLDLTHEAGRATLEARVSRAVSRVCPMATSSYDLESMARHRACRRSAWSGARPQLTALYGDARFAGRAQTAVAMQAR